MECSGYTYWREPCVRIQPVCTVVYPCLSAPMVCLECWWEVPDETRVEPKTEIFV